MSFGASPLQMRSQLPHHMALPIRSSAISPGWRSGPRPIPAPAPAYGRGGWQHTQRPIIIQQMPAPVMAPPPAIVTAQAAPTMVMPPSMPAQASQPNVNAASPGVDMTATQNAAEAATAEAVEASMPPAPSPFAVWGKRILIGAVVAGVGYGGYKFYKSRKKHSGHGHGHGMQGARRRRRR